MSKKNKDQNYAMIRKGKAIKEQMAELNKKGKFKTKEGKRGCIHSKLNKKGKVVSTLINTQDNECICTACKARFPIATLSKSDMKANIISPIINYSNQAIVLGTSIGDDNAVRVFKKYKLSLYKFPKLYGRLVKVAVRVDKNKKKKKFGGSGRPIGSFADR